MGYMIIEVCNREITTIKRDSFLAAHRAMEELVHMAIDDEDEDSVKYEIGKETAYANINGDDYHYDWRIEEI